MDDEELKNYYLKKNKISIKNRENYLKKKPNAKERKRVDYLQLILTIKKILNENI